MRVALPLPLIFIAFHLAVCAPGPFGVWKANTGPSRGGYDHIVMVRFAPHPKGEVFTLDRVDQHGRATTSSTILYLDGKAREFEGFGCSGTQSSRRLNSQTVEILRACNSGESTRMVRRLSADPKQLFLDVTEQQNGARVEQRLILERF